jgi:peptide/nickel transport system permease protein
VVALGLDAQVAVAEVAQVPRIRWRSTSRLRQSLPWTITRRLLLSVPLLLVVSALTFVLLALTPGNAARQILGYKATPQQVAALSRALNLNLPVYEQYWRWLRGALDGNLGSSVLSGQSVTSLVGQRLWATVSLILGTILVFVIIGVLLGAFSAIRGGASDRFADALSLFGYALPTVWVGAVLIEWFAVANPWFPAVGYAAPSQGVGSWLRSLVLPVVTLAVGFIAVLAKNTREAMLDVLATEHIRMARANGVPAWSIVCVYAMKNVAIRVVTITGLLTIGLLGGDVIVENVFGLPGLGAALTSAVLTHDVPVVLGITMIFTIIIIVINLVTDLVYWLLDPRVRV